MSEENLEEWDASFLEELIQVEELALSCSSVNQNNPPSSSYLPPLLPPPPPPPPPSSHHQHLHFAPPSRTDSLSYSPPRELSQRTADFGGALNSNGVFPKCATPSTPVRLVRGSGNAKDLEIERLKKELGRVSKQLADLEQECSQLKKERNKEDQLAFVDSKNEVNVANFHGSRIANLERGIPVAAYHEVIQEFPNAKAFDDQVGLNTVCSTDIDVLFGFINMSSPSKTMEPLVFKSSFDKALQSSVHPVLSSEAAKVSCFYSSLTKISSGMLQLEALFESLIDLCSVENAVIAYRSLHILHVLLKHLLTFERNSEARENFLVERHHSGSGIDDISGYEIRGQVCVSMDGNHASCIQIGVKPSEAETLCKKGHCGTGSTLLFSCINWIHLFELMHLIAVKSSEECVRLEAVSIMNVILMRSDAYTEREKFGLIQVFVSISQLLKKEAGLLVRKGAVHTLYLLLNCPKLVVTFCSGCTMAESADAANDEENTAAFQGFTMILEGLAGCIACCGTSLQALELRKNAITLLAFVASSGKSGFEILVNHKLAREANFLTLILQLLVSEIDLESAVCTESDETFRARTLLIREVLILLNRVVSNPAHSATVLRLLTNSRDMVSLTLDVANRLSRKEQKLRQSDSITKQIRESEIVELGRIFKRRVSTFLGE
ncbi:uncharacterized protein LOC111289660 isoform X5 [Durio zibethinus]|uniref:Uncharacterized protein LOC111289660 isoform X5 n=1 Tax=Durio zibethinus TaxID=66656 RepID=A0A6P5Y8B2_DURZI|nr:uncharacterized protein LOC111289660 isoform X5 [Durio zibethinus]